MDNTELQTAVIALNPSFTSREKADRAAVVVPATALVSLMTTLRDDPSFLFDMLSAHTAIDWPGATEGAEGRLELVYQLHSLTHGHGLMVSVYVPRTEGLVPSVCGVWQIAEWQEREVYDLFGVRYSGHPDLRRIMLEDDWKGHPLLKDYKDDFMLERPW